MTRKKVKPEVLMIAGMSWTLVALHFLLEHRALVQRREVALARFDSYQAGLSDALFERDHQAEIDELNNARREMFDRPEVEQFVAPPEPDDDLDDELAHLQERDDS